ncbi:MAG: hypothetical protein ACLR0U_31080 [Enterocloster clostridioformis]
MAPGYMDTEMCANMSQERKGRVYEADCRRPVGQTRGFKGARTVFSSSASDYLNGAVIPVDGGFLVKS